MGFVFIENLVKWRNFYIFFILDGIVNFKIVLFFLKGIIINS